MAWNLYGLYSESLWLPRSGSSAPQLLNHPFPLYSMLVDYVRVYQDPSNKMLGCDPEDMPTAAYIASISEAYSNPNIVSIVAVLPIWRCLNSCNSALVDHLGSDTFQTNCAQEPAGR